MLSLQFNFTQIAAGGEYDDICKMSPSAHFLITDPVYSAWQGECTRFQFLWAADVIQLSVSDSALQPVSMKEFVNL